jgi:P27 family predicted phage terminase small subunit
MPCTARSHMTAQRMCQTCPLAGQSFLEGPGREFAADLKRLCHLLQERRTLTAGDVELIRIYCFQYDRHVRNVKLLRAEGEVCTYTVLDSNGQPISRVKENVRMKVVANAERQMADILNKLGLTPTAKDRAKPTNNARGSLQVIPGSLADTRPDLFDATIPPPAQKIVLPDLRTWSWSLTQTRLRRKNERTNA